MSGKFPRSDDGNAINVHLSADIESLIQLFDPELFQFLVKDDQSSEIFIVMRSVCFQWLLIDFKREFGYDDVYRVWETMWAAQMYVSPRFELFVALALIELYRDVIMSATEDLSAFTEAFRMMRGKHDVERTLEVARRLAFRLQTAVYGVGGESVECGGKVANGACS